jgi:eukaryotic sulfide quinone oxidoreductase
MLAEFKYGFEPKESFGQWFDQAKPQRPFYYLKTDLFPWAYYNSMVRVTTRLSDTAGANTP